ncbi:hypothetical protein BaRGS_00015164 [Batillaria attramentaria]|uniref:Uncharacterized protein n=1 Tax=Batillaria attramentaria TaxID=370345 RepID=A0ABD0L2M1_9CAEN
MTQCRYYHPDKPARDYVCCTLPGRRLYVAVERQVGQKEITMERGGFGLLCLLAVFSVLQRPGCCQYQQIGCTAGWYGSVCDKQCSDKCRPDNNGIITCRQDDGRCTTGCISGWRGPQCTLPCVMNCDGGCDQDNGVCDGCFRDYYGVRCQFQCECETGYYGVESCEECGYCRDDVCNNHNGHCPRGCRDGFDGDRCDRCNRTRWGSNCSLPCGQCAGDGSCDMDTGRCISGCLEGFEGEACTLKLLPVLSKDSSIPAGPVIGGVLGAVALVGVTVLLGILIKRRRGLREAATAGGDASACPTGANNSPGATQSSICPENNKTGTDVTYAPLEEYFHPDDLSPYTTLSTDRSHPESKCETGYYGVESCEECGYCRDDVCNNGHCPRGCRDGFDGDRCDSEYQD